MCILYKRIINICVYLCMCVIMGRMQIVISDQVEKDLRKKAAERFSLKKGAISQAIEEAIKDWLKK